MPLNLNYLYERDVPFMSKATNPKDGKTDFNAFSRSSRSLLYIERKSFDDQL